ncbi:MAG: LysM peptidoglycan-binding domain-containing protein [Candidatus Pacebacteria bacterium]|nr:LysM peptidoglycan-binding domain-containing protein [Candidatus Paceibacterota bacterium]PIR63981.1 MAG: hypothetical protein COU64_01615 [Candidatus Pacebacteria bacterium CG10_big_fil_rev_8_21_14_0_10_40_26]PIZ79092.1 MAG: hypothetical protein COY01_01550 [Candidatus Pacebacteria bacterium CG_4_10_14_0_2_um_filter_40_20]PJA69220.1 MAG: hypothetical protein CO156_01285 [Candidatus Pacebacteria bacterium CG_4_9_14_3_um_filter_40_12]PJC42058.1 MAG: hypothetical protein CO041_00260 [Candidatu
MNKSRFLVFVLSMAIVLTVACTANEAEPVAQLNAAPVTNVPPTPTFTIDMLASYHPRTYYLRPGENLLSVAEMIAGYTPYEPEIVVEALVRFNAGNLAYTDTGLPEFANNSELASVLIPDAPGIPSNIQLGIQNPRRNWMSITIVEGDTLCDLAQAYGFGTYQEFATAVGIRNPDSYVLMPNNVLHWEVEEPAEFLGWPQN